VNLSSVSIIAGLKKVLYIVVFAATLPAAYPENLSPILYNHRYAPSINRINFKQLNLTIMKSNPRKNNQHPLTDSIRRFLLPIAILFIAATSSAQLPSLSPMMERKEVNVTGTCRQVNVYGDVRVVLTNDAPGTLLLEGNGKDIDCVKTIANKHELFINAGRKKSFSQLVIYLPAAGISSLVINGNAEIVSSTMIKAPELEITLCGNALVAVKYEGKIKVKAADGYELEDKKYFTRKIKPGK
jgi:hypothetical protein